MTKEQILKSRKFSPGIIGGEVIDFIESGTKNHFWFKPQGADCFVKNEKGKYCLISIDEVVDARLLYLSSFEINEKEELINREIKAHKARLKEKAEIVIKKITQHELQISDKFSESLTGMILSANEQVYNKAVQESKDFFINNPKALNLKNALEQAIAADDFDTVYNLVELKFGQATVSFKTTGDLTAFVNMFGSQNINETLDKTKELGSLYLIAKAKVEKSFYPEG